jgi:hypothetical protein
MVLNPGSSSDITIGLEKVDLGNGRTSLVAGAALPTLQRILRTVRRTTTKHGDQIIELLARDFGESGASHGGLQEAYCKEAGASESTFARALRDVQSRRVRKEGEGKNARVCGRRCQCQNRCH